MPHSTHQVHNGKNACQCLQLDQRQKSTHAHRQIERDCINLSTEQQNDMQPQAEACREKQEERERDRNK